MVSIARQAKKINPKSCNHRDFFRSGQAGENQRRSDMEDETILDLYFAREERAIAETGKKYGGY